MKKLIVILAIVAVASPVMADVTVTASQVAPGSQQFTVSYAGASTSDPDQAVRAFALNISLSNGTIAAVSCSNSSYYIYPGSIQISGGSVQSYGDCVCASSYPGTLGGIGTSGVTVEMGSLYAVGGSKPAASGTLMTVTASGTFPNTVTLAANTARGGVVFENPDSSTGVTITGTTLVASGGPTECYPSNYTAYNDWKSAGKPDCWCGTNTAGMTAASPVKWPFQCYGDADNSTEGVAKYRIYNNDYNKLVSNWKKKITESWDRCADFDHKSEGVAKYRVYNNDYNKLVSNWKKKDSQFTGTGNCPVPNQ